MAKKLDPAPSSIFHPPSSLPWLFLLPTPFQHMQLPIRGEVIEAAVGGLPGGVDAGGGGDFLDEVEAAPFAGGGFGGGGAAGNVEAGLGGRGGPGVGSCGLGRRGGG